VQTMKERKPFSIFGEQNLSFFQKEEELIAKLRQISHSTRSPQQIGIALENFIASFLRELLPANFRVETRCRVIDKKGNYSREIDLAIVEANFPKLFSSVDGSSLLMYESIKQIFELKRSLDSKEISDIFTKAHDWHNFWQKATGRKRIHSIPLSVLCIESKIGLKTLRIKLLNESIKYNNVINSTNLFILRIKENNKRQDSSNQPIGAFCWWEELTDLSFNLTYAPLSDCIYDLYLNISKGNIRKSVMGYFHWGTVWTRDRIEKYLKKKDTNLK
jgi:hypothetical protein